MFFRLTLTGTAALALLASPVHAQNEAATRLTKQRTIVRTPTDDSSGVATGTARFKGALDIDGERTEFDTIEAFRDALRSRGLGDFDLDLDALIPRLGQDGSDAFSGSLAVDGETYRFCDRDAYEAARQAIADGSPDLAELLKKGTKGERAATSVFRGVMNTNGAKREFDDEAAYEKALAELGLGDAFGPGARKSSSSVFAGSLGVDGKTYSFDDRDAFEAARLAMRNGSPDLKELLEKGKPCDGSTRAFRGSMNINGVERVFDDEEAYRSALGEHGLLGLWLPGAQRDAASAFSGSLGVDGKTFSFDDREAFEAARRALADGSPDLEALLQAARPNRGSSVFNGSLHLGGDTLRFDDLESFRLALREHGLGDFHIDVESRTSEPTEPLPRSLRRSAEADDTRD